MPHQDPCYWARKDASFRLCRHVVANQLAAFLGSGHGPQSLVTLKLPYLDDSQTYSSGYLLILSWAWGSLFFPPSCLKSKLAVRGCAARWMARVQRQTELCRPGEPKPPCVRACPLLTQQCKMRVRTRGSSAAPAVKKEELPRSPILSNLLPLVAHQKSAAGIHVARAIPCLGRVHTTDEHSLCASTSILPCALVSFTSCRTPSLTSRLPLRYLSHPARYVHDGPAAMPAPPAPWPGHIEPTQLVVISSQLGGDEGAHALASTHKTNPDHDHHVRGDDLFVT